MRGSVGGELAHVIFYRLKKRERHWKEGKVEDKKNERTEEKPEFRRGLRRKMWT